jgi:hypothetical protein
LELTLVDCAEYGIVDAKEKLSEPLRAKAVTIISD